MGNSASSPLPFGVLRDGSSCQLHGLEVAGGLRMTVAEYGGTIVSLWAPDRDGREADVVLGYGDAAGYENGNSYFGAIIGRYGNRIARGRFTLDGAEYQLSVNNGPNHLHGGPGGFDRVPWRVEPAGSPTEPALKLSRQSPDGEEGYPGNMTIEVTYTLVGLGDLRIDYFAKTDRATPVNLTNHSYFNLAGHNAGPILDHELSISASRMTAVDAGLIPTGELRSVAETPFDFLEPHRVGERIDAADEQISFGPGYDHNFVLDSPGGLRDLRSAARVYEPGSGRALEVLTSEPAIQFYSGNFLDGSQVGKGGTAYQFRCGFCLETQHFPDSPNQPAFPTTILVPGTAYRSSTIYRFSAH